MNNQNNEVIIKADEVFFSYEEENGYALDGLSLEIKRGKRTALMGANGSGKSTFFLCCVGILKPQKGAMYVDGKQLSYDKKGLLNLRSKVGIVFQEPDNQLFSANVFQEISFGVLNLGHSKEEARREVEEVMEQLEITLFRDRPVHMLSGGQKKQVSIADVLVMRPEIVLLDEPAAALDPRHTHMVNRMVDEMSESGITVLVSTHDVDYAYEWADEVVIFAEGKVFLQGTPQEVFQNKEALACANLEPPVTLEIFESLVENGVLDRSLNPPRDRETLRHYIEERAVCSIRT